MGEELEMTKLVLAWLREHGYVCWRMPISGVMKGNGYMVKSPLKGFPDIAGLLKTQRGRFFALELKTAKGVLSQAQEEWCARLSEGGACVMAIRSLDVLPLAMSAAERGVYGVAPTQGFSPCGT